MLGQLIEAGANVFRLNMSHSKHDWVREVVFRIRRKAAELKANVAILFDLQGPSIRTGDLLEPYHLKRETPWKSAWAQPSRNFLFHHGKL